MVTKASFGSFSVSILLFITVYISNPCTYHAFKGTVKFSTNQGLSCAPKRRAPQQTDHAFIQTTLHRREKITETTATTSLSMGFFDGVQKMLKNFSMKATASHILIKGGAEAENKLEDLKAEINNNPVAFAKAASEYSACPSGRSGGNLGEFGPGQMVKEFDQVVFNEPVGVVQGPIK
eukprot:CAMPEP_0195521404 /NCGR_PEP_ID=MMETSP0794_2-20130614/18613_1 /TAXON_ID=515487 /ORGANISM="Stephanopyxis turris, Strain CCMP 815" /LENGTH=177 /DNA_ID=CAMNT_0040650953 /DNA_START=55 /DNA_END=585 /DNA_ORIENTATION=-